MPSYNFKCKNEHITTLYITMDELTATCKCEKCGLEAKRYYSSSQKPIIPTRDTEFKASLENTMAKLGLKEARKVM